MYHCPLAKSGTHARLRRVSFVLVVYTLARALYRITKRQLMYEYNDFYCDMVDAHALYCRESRLFRCT